MNGLRHMRVDCEEPLCGLQAEICHCSRRSCGTNTKIPLGERTKGQVQPPPLPSRLPAQRHSSAHSRRHSAATVWPTRPDKRSFTFTHLFALLENRRERTRLNMRSGSLMVLDTRLADGFLLVSERLRPRDHRGPSAECCLKISPLRPSG